MLHEISHVRQSNLSEIKRCFTDADMYLFACCRYHIPLRFQLALNRRSKEQVISLDIQWGYASTTLSQE